MRKTIFGFLVGFGLAAAAGWAASTFTTNYSLEKPGIGDTGWGTALNANADTVDANLKDNTKQVSITNTTAPQLRVKYDGTNYGDVSVSSVGAVTVAAEAATDSNGQIILDADAGADIVFQLNAVEIGRWDGTANYFGIGEANPDRKLAVSNNNSTGSAMALFLNTSTGGGNLELLVYGTGATGSTFGVSNADLVGIAFQNGTNNVVGSLDATPLIFGTSGAERMRILSTGEVGIGTTVPARLFHTRIDNNTGGSIFILDNIDGINANKNFEVVINGAGTAGTTLGISNASLMVLNFQNTSGVVFSTTADAVPMVFGTANSERFRITGAGDIGANDSTPDRDFDVGCLSANVADTAWTNECSDRDFKEQVQPISQSVLPMWEGVGVYSYRFKKAFLKEINKRPDLKDEATGLIVEDPDVVKWNTVYHTGFMADDFNLSFNPIFGNGGASGFSEEDLRTALILAIKELITENKNLKTRVGILEAKVQ